MVILHSLLHHDTLFEVEGPKTYAETCPEHFTPKEISPTQWYDRTLRICQSDPSYTGSCQGDADFTNMAVTDLQAWAKRCQTDWPCTTHCEYKVPSICPKDWKFIGDDVQGNKTCLAPQSYRGPCPLAMSFTNFTDCMKDKFATKCGISWPCEKDPVDREHQNWNKECPDEWTLNDFECVAKEAPKCGISRISTIGWSVEMKQAFAKECDIRWPHKPPEIPPIKKTGKVQLLPRKLTIYDRQAFDPLESSPGYAPKAWVL